MVDAVKRTYSSALRTEQARQTTALIVSSATRLFVEGGFGSTTIDQIAEAAGVSRKTVFAAVGGKTRILKVAIDVATVGDDEPIPLLQRREIQALAAETDPHLILQSWARLTTAISSRLAGLSLVLTEAAGIDPDIRQLQEQAQKQRLQGARAFIEFLADRGVLRADLTHDEAVDLVWFYSDPTLYQRLVLNLSWTPERFERWLFETITQQLS